MVRTFKTKFLREELDLPWEATEDKILDQDRWSTFHEIVFEYEGKYYQTTYSVGSTECQDERPWEYEEELEATEVEQKEVLVKKWVPVE